jgi:hypothetical protein
MYEELDAVSDIPDFELAVVDYDEHADMSRHVLFNLACACHD